MCGAAGRLGKDTGGEAMAGKSSGRKSISIGIVDDHPMYRMGLRQALEREPDLKVLWELPSANTIDAQLRRNPVDVVLMDVSMGQGKDGIAATRELTEKWPRVKVIVISASVDEGQVLASSRAGADGFLAKDLPASDMVSSIRSLAGGLVPGRRAPGDLLDAMHRDSEPKLNRGERRAIAGVESLSPRQRQVLDELRFGRTNREIAERLGISIATVNKHVHQVLTALKVRNRTQAAAIAGRL
jgi:two-component system, NarL family, nitrate/nitrite response regulator NarL